jgi:hypothetical protein
MSLSPTKALERLQRLNNYRTLFWSRDRGAMLVAEIIKDYEAQALDQLVTCEGDETLRRQGAVRMLRTLLREMSEKPTPRENG